MAKSINLYQDNFNKKSKVRSIDVALYSVLAVLALTIGGFFLLKMLNVSTQGEIDSVKEDTQALTESINEDELKEVNAQYLRFQEVGSSGNDAETMLSHFALLEQSLVPEVTLASYTYSDENEKSMNITITSDFIDGVSKQLTAFDDMSDKVSAKVVSMTLGEESFEAEISVTLR